MSRRAAIVLVALGLLGPILLVSGAVDPSAFSGRRDASASAKAIGFGAYLLCWATLIAALVQAVGRRDGAARAPRSALRARDLLVALFVFAAHLVAGQLPFAIEIRLALVLGAQLVLAAMLVMYAEGVRRERDPGAAPALRPGRFGADARRGVLFVLAAYPAVQSIAIVTAAVLQRLGQPAESQPIIDEMLRPEASDTVLVLFVLIAVIGAPVFEEVLFRGFLQSVLRRVLGRWGAIGVSAVVFGAVHVTWSAVFPLILLGVVLGMVHDRTRSLAGPIAGHMAFNAVTVAVIIADRGG